MPYDWADYLSLSMLSVTVVEDLESYKKDEPIENIPAFIKILNWVKSIRATFKFVKDVEEKDFSLILEADTSATTEFVKIVDYGKADLKESKEKVVDIFKLLEDLEEVLTSAIRYSAVNDDLKKKIDKASVFFMAASDYATDKAGPHSCFL